MNMVSASSTEALPVSIQTVSDQKYELGILENTWPGEILSLGDIQIQPKRAGTIVEWNINIGQKIKTGQVIAKLSAPPAMPELTSMLAEQAKMLTEARVDAKAQIEFAEKKKQQLNTLLDAIEKAKTENFNVLGSDPSAAPSLSATAAQTILQAKNAVASDQQKIRSFLEQAVSKELELLGNVDFDIVSYYKKTVRAPLYVYIKEPFGAVNSEYRYKFIDALDKVLREFVKDNSNLDTTGTVYFDAAVKMAALTYSGDEFTPEHLTEIRQMIAMDRMKFLETVKDYQMSKIELVKMETEFRLMLTEKEIDYAMQKKEIKEQIAMLEKDISMSNGKAEAASASFNTVAGSINGSLPIISPANGVISSIMKKNGDFVEPGMAVASLNTGRKEDKFVRFKIPSNIRLPESGTKLAITRPSFPKDIKYVKLVGVGTALDGNGSYLADAKFIDSSDWPVNISIRVLHDSNAPPNLFVHLGALEWNDKGTSLWIVNADNTIKKQTIKTGRTLGEKIEVYEGVMVGDRYITKLIPELKEGIKVREGEVSGSLKLEKMDMDNM